MTLPEFPPDRGQRKQAAFRTANRILRKLPQQKQVAVAVRFALADLFYGLSEPNPVPNQAQDASNNVASA